MAVVVSLIPAFRYSDIPIVYLKLISAVVFCCDIQQIVITFDILTVGERAEYTLPETSSSPLKIDDFQVLLRLPLVSGRVEI